MKQSFILYLLAVTILTVLPTVKAVVGGTTVPENSQKDKITTRSGTGEKPGENAGSKTDSNKSKKQNDVLELKWEDLIPSDFHPEKLLDIEKLATMDDDDPRAKKIMRVYQYAMKRAPTVRALNGSMVKIPGFVVPLEMDGTKATEFLLVPYFGACIHVPPPPANQVVHVKAIGKGSVAKRSWYDTVWVIGRLTIERLDNKLGSSGYAIAAEKIEPYRE